MLRAAAKLGVLTLGERPFDELGAVRCAEPVESAPDPPRADFAAALAAELARAPVICVRRAAT